MAKSDNLNSKNYYFCLKKIYVNVNEVKPTQFICFDLARCETSGFLWDYVNEE